MQKPRIGAAILVEHKGKYLLGKRNKLNCYGKWIIPGGGVEWGEKLDEAAIRELKEETNIEVENLKLLGHKEIINLPGDYHRVVFFFLAKAKNDNIIVNDDISEAKFFSLEEINNLDTLESVEWVLNHL